LTYGNEVGGRNRSGKERRSRSRSRRSEVMEGRVADIQFNNSK